MFRVDHTDPRFLIAYTGDHHAHAEDYQQALEVWKQKLEQNPEPFGVILVNEAHEHDHHDEERDGEEEAAFSKMLNDYRQIMKDKTSALNWGFCNVYTPELAAQFEKNDPALIEQFQERALRFAQYMFGIPGRNFTDIEAAKEWLLQQGAQKMSNDTDTNASQAGNNAVGLFYGSTTGVTEYVAFEIEAAWKKQGMEPIVAINLSDVKNMSDIFKFRYLLLGIPTWNIGELQDDWDFLMPQLDDLDLTGVHAAIFGIGDQYNYPDNFLDAVGIVGNKLIERGAQLHGYWSTEGYEHLESLAVDGDQFMGLGIDEVNQPDLTGQRVEQWVAQVIQEFALQPNPAN